MRCFTIPALVGIVVLSACSSETDSVLSDDNDSSTTTAMTAGPRAGATYSGDLVGSANVSGRVTFKISASGDIIDPFVMLEMRDYDCGGGVSLTSGQGVAPIGVAIATVDGTFEYDSTSVTWRGTFTSDSLATGTVQGNLVHPDCEFGPLEWTAELTSVSELTTTTVQASGTTPTTAVSPGEYAELCAVNQRIEERAEEATTETEGAEFWEAQSDDTALMVDLVPDILRADMALNADAWRQFVELLSEYGYHFQTLISSVGNEGYTNIFTPDVTAANARVQEFIGTTCAP